MSETRICEEGGRGVLLPFWSTEHEDLSTEARGILYAAGLVYFFVGVSIVSEMFMNAIEEITSRRKQVKISGDRYVTLKVWNATVANLTLMALGSSAPEILLAVIEIITKDFFTGELGAAVIVGSASFNLLAIVGLCILVIPSSEIRKLQEMDVFVVTVVFMLLAYIWLVVVIVWISPDVIDLWEAVVTFLGLPVLVGISYLADVGMLRRVIGTSRGASLEQQEALVQQVHSALLDSAEAEDQETLPAIRLAVAQDSDSLRRMVTSEVPDDQAELRAVVAANKAASRYRDVRQLAASRIRGVSESVSNQSDVNLGSAIGTLQPAGVGRPYLQFASVQQSVSAELDVKPLTVMRCGDHQGLPDIRVQYSIKVRKDRETSRTALVMSLCRQSNEVPLEILQRGEFTVRQGEDFKDVPIELPRQLGSGSDFSNQEFVVTLETAEAVEQRDCVMAVDIGPLSSTVVTRVPEGQPGILCFPHERVLVPAASSTQRVQCLVERLDGCSGRASCSFRTLRLSSVPGFGYEETEGEIDFPPGVTERMIEVQILPKKRANTSERFALILEDAEGSCLDPNSDGGKDSTILTVEIMAMQMQSSGARSATGGMSFSRSFTFDEGPLLRSAWREQLQQAIFCNGSLEAQRDASWLDWIFHVVTVPWKLFFMPIPPAVLLQGWVCFACSLFYIALLTAFIGEMAEIFGCVVGLPDFVTGITFVALGTSMPDLFASRTAAVQDATADASIINVTGSNCVNVFLGLGFPWTFGAVVWSLRGPTDDWVRRYGDVAGRPEMRDRAGLVIQAASELTFGVSVFVVLCFVAVLILLVRRQRVGGELGGPLVLKVLSSLTFFILWAAYIALASSNSLSKQNGGGGDPSIVYLGVAIVVCCFVVVTIVTAFLTPSRLSPTLVSPSESASATPKKELQVDTRNKATGYDSPKATGPARIEHETREAETMTSSMEPKDREPKAEEPEWQQPRTQRVPQNAAMSLEERYFPIWRPGPVEAGGALAPNCPAQLQPCFCSPVCRPDFCSAPSVPAEPDPLQAWWCQADERRRRC